MMLESREEVVLDEGVAAKRALNSEFSHYEAATEPSKIGTSAQSIDAPSAMQSSKR